MSSIEKKQPLFTNEQILEIADRLEFKPSQNIYALIYATIISLFLSLILIICLCVNIKKTNKKFNNVEDQVNIICDEFTNKNNELKEAFTSSNIRYMQSRSDSKSNDSTLMEKMPEFENKKEAEDLFKALDGL